MALRKLVVHWPRFGPYHLARLRALEARCNEEGIQLIGLETAALDEVYEWREERAEEPFERRQVFPGRTFESIAPREMERGVYAALDAIQPDAVAIHTYSFPDSRACAHWCRRNRRAAIVMTDSKADDAERSYVREFLKRQVLSAYDAAVLSGSLSRDYLSSLGVQRIQLGYDVVDNDAFASAAEAARRNPDAWRHLPGLASGRPFFLISSRFIARKNLVPTLRAFSAYREASQDPWDLVILGDGPLRPELEHEIAQLPTGTVTLAGFRQIDEIPAYYAFAGALLHPALLDQWALVVNEAMACGLPVLVSTGAGCHPELVFSGENGYTFDPKEPDEIAAAMLRLTDHHEELQRMAARSLEIIADWSPDRFADAVLKAARSGHQVADRPYPILARLTIGLMSRMARSVNAFHAVEA